MKLFSLEWARGGRNYIAFMSIENPIDSTKKLLDLINEFG